MHARRSVIGHLPPLIVTDTTGTFVPVVLFRCRSVRAGFCQHERSRQYEPTKNKPKLDTPTRSNRRQCAVFYNLAAGQLI